MAETLGPAWGQAARAPLMAGAFHPSLVSCNPIVELLMARLEHASGVGTSEFACSRLVPSRAEGIIST